MPPENEICAECGKSVKMGSGRFVNRIPILDSYNIRKENGRPYPQGGYICEKCDVNVDEN